MKKILLALLMFSLFSCASKAKRATGMDSMNSIEDHPAQDTTVSPNPNGYTPPNTKVDTSQRIKDSIDSSRH